MIFFFSIKLRLKNADMEMNKFINKLHNFYIIIRIIGCY